LRPSSLPPSREYFTGQCADCSAGSHIPNVAKYQITGRATVLTHAPAAGDWSIATRLMPMTGRQRFQQRGDRLPVHSALYAAKDAGVAVPPGLSSFPNSKPQFGQTSYDGLPRKSSYGGVMVPS
jgi:hypothetical protein